VGKLTQNFLICPKNICIFNVTARDKSGHLEAKTKITESRFSGKNLKTSLLMQLNPTIF